MILLDTNVLSEVQRHRPDPDVIAWLDAQPLRSLAVSAVTVAELLVGVETLPEGNRRQRLAEAVAAQVAVFQERVLAFDLPAAEVLASLTAQRRRSGRPLPLADGQIAATALVHGAALATRNMADFAGLGLDLIDPWRSR